MHCLYIYKYIHIHVIYSDKYLISFTDLPKKNIYKLTAVLILYKYKFNAK